ncbi:MAG TPA: proprotein convertase P-domain-containing protein [Terrimicrobiaceae bacterium]
MNLLSRLSPFLLTLLFGWTLSAAHSEPLKVNLVNNNPNFPNSRVYVMFGGTDGELVGTATVDGSADTKLVEGVCYAFSKISDIQLSAFPNGKIYISLGSPLTSASSANGFRPNFTNKSEPDYYTRWDKVEITYAPEDRNSRATLSATDFFSVPLQITTSSTDNPDQAFAPLIWRAPTSTIFSELAALSNASSAALVLGNHGIHTSYGQVVRIISPSSVRDSSVYPSLGPYINFVKANELSILVRGSHRKGQSYNLKASIDKEGDLVMNGTVTGAPISETHITIANDDLLKGIYTCNVKYTVNKTPHNTAMKDVYASAVGDILGGFNLGFIGSTEVNPNTGNSFGAGPSDKWYQPAIPANLAFARAQPANSNFYNQYASYLSAVSDAHAFPLSDFIRAPSASLDPSTVGTLSIAVCPDDSASGKPSASSPVASLGDQKQVTSSREVRNQTSTAYSNITLKLRIDHPAIEDLEMKLRSPRGRTFLLRNRSIETAGDQSSITFTLSSSQIVDPNGTWTLSITDRKKGNAGTLVDWKLDFGSSFDMDYRSGAEKKERRFSTSPQGKPPSR